jgi:hypothetical protein
MAGGLAVAIYLFIPIVLLSVRTVIGLPIHETEWAAQPRWKRPVGALRRQPGSLYARHR